MISRKFFRLLPLFCIGAFQIFGQTRPTTITYKYHKKMLPIEPYWFTVFKPLLNNAYGEDTKFPSRFISSTTIGDSCLTKYEFYIPNITCASLPDIFGHEIIILPGDKIVVHIGEVNKSRISGLKGQFVRQWAHDLSYSGQNKYVYSLFDSLANFNGDLRNGSILRFKKNDLTLDSFCRNVEDHYLSRLQYMERYSKKHSISPAVQNLVKAEIYSAYLINLAVPLMGGRNKTLTDYPPVYAALIKNAKFDDEGLYFRTNLYSLIALEYYNWDVKNSNKPGSSGLQNFVEKYDWLKNNYKGKIREHQITAFLNSYSSVTPFKRSIDSLIVDFSAFAANKNYIKYLYQLHTPDTTKKEIIYTLSQAMASEVTNTKDEKKSVADLIHKKPVVMICWASWCKPCIEELPYETVLEKEFGSKIDFVYLSFDSFKPNWIAKSAELNLTNNSYLVSNYFKSDLAKYYKIKSIPRYLIYDKEGNIIKDSSLRPSDNKFRSVLLDLTK
jgi:thiol-disulfide isomerase/thioredoxin